MGTPTSPSAGSDSTTPVNGRFQNCPSPLKRVNLKVEVKSYCRIRQQDGTLTPSGKNSEGSRINRTFKPDDILGVLSADVVIVGKDIKGTTAKGKKYSPAILDITCLEDGTYKLHVEPPASRKSSGPAGPATKGKVTKRYTDLEGRMYREVDVSVRIAGRKAVEAHTVSVVNYANAWVKDGPSDTVFIDLKPDWWFSISKKKKKRRKKKDGTPYIDLIALHNTGALSDGKEEPVDIRFGAPISEGLQRYCGHYYVDLDGHIVKVHHEADWYSYHAARTWLGGSTNERTIGIEICRPLPGFQQWKDGSVKPLGFLQQAQFDSVVRLVKDLQGAYNIPKHRIIGHYDSEDGHPACPGCDFWWEHLEAIGLGMILHEPTSEDPDYAIWFESHAYIDVQASNTVAGKKVVAKIVKDLRDIGYAVSKDLWTPPPGHKIIATQKFQKHFYTGVRYKSRFEAMGKPHTGEFPPNSPGKVGVGKLGATPTAKVDRNLARRIRAVADYVRSRETPMGDFPIPTKNMA